MMAHRFALFSSPTPVPIWQRVCLLLLAGVVFYSTYGLSNWLSAQHASLPELAFAWERHIPFAAWTIVPYWSLNVFYALGFLLCRRRGQLFAYFAQLMLAQAIAVACFVLWPLQFSWPKPPADGVSGWLFHTLAAFDQPYNQAPSLHIILTLVVGRFYWLRLPERWRPVWVAWLVLIATSVLTTYQHHFIDIPSGLAVGLLIWWLFPAAATAVMPLRRTLKPTPAHRRWAAGYTVLAILLAGMGSLGGLGLWCLWPALACVLLASAYIGLGAQALQKQADGRCSAATAVWLWPYRCVVWLNMRFWLHGRVRHVAVFEQVSVGSILAAPAFDRVVDVCAEYPLRAHPSVYACVPMLDMVPPEPDALVRAAQAMDAALAPGASVLVCCALGLGRSVATVAFWLCYAGHCDDIQAALSLLRQQRPDMALSIATQQRLQQAWAAQQETPL